MPATDRRARWAVPTLLLLFRGTICKKALHSLFYLSACCWILYSFHRYLPRLRLEAFPEIYSGISQTLSRWGLWDLLLIVWLWIVADLIGRRFLEALRVPLNPGIERWSLSSAVGISLLSLVMFVLSAVKMLYTPVAYGLLVLPTALWYREFCSAAAKVWTAPARPTGSRPFSAGPIGHFFILVYTTIVLSVVLLSSLGPEIEYDPLIMHLLAAKTFVRHHGLTAIPDVPQTFLPKNVTMLFSFGMLLHNEITAKLINYLLGLLIFLGTYGFAVKRFSRSTGLVAVAMLASTPLLLWEMRTAHLDCGFALYVSLALFATLRWLEGSDLAWFRLAVYLTAFSLGTKYQALFALGSLAMLVLLYRLIQHRRLSLAGAQAMKFFLLSAIGLLPWAIVNLMHAGNPIFPFLNGIFQSPFWSPAQTATVLSQMSESAVPVTWTHPWVILTAFWKMATDQNNPFHGNIGPFYLILIPLLVFQPRMRLPTRLLLSFSFFYWIFWLFTAQHLRYFLGAVPALAIVAADAAVTWLEMVQIRTWKVLASGAAVVLALLAALNSPFFENYGVNSRYGYSIMETLPLKYLQGEESRDEYLAGHVPDYPAVQYLNHLPGRKKVLFWWTDPAPAGFYLDGDAAFIFSPFAQELFTDDPEQIRRVLRDNGVTHIVVSQIQQEINLLSNPEGVFVQRHLKKLYQGNGMNLYEFSDEPLRQEVVSYDFLSHLDEAKFTMPSEPPGRPKYDYRVMGGIGDVRRYALRTVPPAEIEFSLSLPERPRMRFALGRQFPPCLNAGGFQLWMVPENGEKRLLLQQTLSGQIPTRDVGWFEQQVDLSPWAGRRVNLLFKTDISGGECAWSLWADPVVVSLP